VPSGSDPDAAPPDPVSAWLVRGGEEAFVGGTLSIERRDLVLRGEGEERARIALSRVRTARRTRGTPVIVLRVDDGVLLLYFVEPPRLSLRGEAPKLRGWDRVSGDRGLARAAGMTRLRTAGKDLRGRVKEWERAIRAQAGSTATNLRPREE